MPGIDMGGLDLPSLLPHPPPFFHRRHFRRLLRPRAIQGHFRSLLRPKTFVGSISVHEIAAYSLASSGKGALDNSTHCGSAFRPSFVIPVAHHWRLRFIPPQSFVGPFPSQSCHSSAITTGNPGFTTDPGVIITAGADQSGLPLQVAVNYFGPSIPTISAAVSPSTRQTELNSPPRTRPAPSTTNFFGLLRLQQRPYRPRKPQRQPFALGVPQHSHSRPPIAFYWASSFTSAPTTSSADTTTPPPWAWRASRYPLKTTLSITIRTVVEDLHHAFPQRAWL